MSDPNSLAELYFDALLLPTDDVSCASLTAHRAALSRAHELRKFEIENYWKRATYFWAFQLAAFTLLGLLWKETVGPPPTLHENVLMIPAGLGSITGLVGWMTARGSKFWQENWECHVDMLESKLEGRLTQVVFNRGGAKFSVSRVNEKLLFVITAGWVLLFLAIIFWPTLAEISEIRQRVLGLLSLLGAVLFLWIGAKTRLSGMVTSRDKWERLENGALRNKMRRWLRLPQPETTMVLRDTLAGKSAAPKPVKVGKARK